MRVAWVDVAGFLASAPEVPIWEVKFNQRLFPL
jgi:hypothetical protein